MTFFNCFLRLQIRLIFTPAEPTLIDTPKIYLYGDYFKFSGTTTQNSDGAVVPLPTEGTDMFILH